MNYCGIDLGGESSYVFVTDAKGTKLWAGTIKTTATAFQELVKKFSKEGLAIAIEAGNQTNWVYRTLVDAGAKVTVVNPKKVKLIAESRRKTDKVDAKILCELLRLDGLPEPVHMPSPQTLKVRRLLSARRQLVRQRTKLCNFVRSALRQAGIRLPARALCYMVGWERLLQGGVKAPELLTIVSIYYPVFVQLTQSIRELDRQLAELLNDARVKRLKTMPKVGPIAALTFVAAVDDVKRFSSSRKLISYAGLAPTVRQSSERTQYGPITREGRRELRAVWVQIAHLVVNDTTPATRPLRAWFDRVARRRGRKTAIVGLARRLLVIAYQLVKNDVDYQVERLKRKRRVA
ncbi:MAG: hypothetical protein KatS3mg110_0937 [Pirellulaceae bacterium]|nr:MAG: hypothetical protein KatS3mg110_0937 [Pirellulaceae bacterium]